MNIDELKDMTCDECGSNLFNPVFSIKIVPALLSQSGEESALPIIAGYSCLKCNHINDVFIPKKEKKSKSKIILP